MVGNGAVGDTAVGLTAVITLVGGSGGVTVARGEGIGLVAAGVCNGGGVPGGGLVAILVGGATGVIVLG